MPFLKRSICQSEQINIKANENSFISFGLPSMQIIRFCESEREGESVCGHYCALWIRLLYQTQPNSYIWIVNGLMAVYLIFEADLIQHLCFKSQFMQYLVVFVLPL